MFYLDEKVDMYLTLFTELTIAYKEHQPISIRMGEPVDRQITFHLKSLIKNIDLTQNASILLLFENPDIEISIFVDANISYRYSLIDGHPHQEPKCFLIEMDGAIIEINTNPN